MAAVLGQTKAEPKPAEEGFDFYGHLNQEETQQRLKSYLPQKNQNATFFCSKKDATELIAKDSVDSKNTLFVFGCEDIDLTVEARLTKILIQGCKNAKITLRGPILTNVVELWSCDNVTLNIEESLVATLQLDLVNKIDVCFSRKKLMFKIIHAGVEDMTLTFGDSDDKLLSSFSQLKVKHTDIRKDITQWIVHRDSNNELLEERLMRLPNGFPATKKEIEDWETNKEIMESKTEDHLRELIKIAPKTDLGGGVRIKTIKHEGDLPPQPKTKAQLKKAARKEAEAKAAAAKAAEAAAASAPAKNTGKGKAGNKKR
eukprot:CAMPEP_0177651640 /NCGR_PEP_ID=MMETSP0447-20121125/12670_1 /TAXON_ID=0 /ORGANISM="Stygamoeba regulata, Strain BSH-02190019" /LENGTH=314 /DNA_ID=CAMNT_0019154763 /DNA_START=132 /DNA_END=1076 /DNA_ORIENTATION=-